MTFIYDIREFWWEKRNNTFYADGWDLYPVGDFMGIESFPNARQQFYIHNFKTGGFRRFTFLREVYDGTEWLFTSEDGILCQIMVVP